MNAIDATISIILIIAFVRGWIKGLIMGVISLLGVFIAIYIAIHFSYFSSDFLHEYISTEQSLIDLIAYCVTFAAVLFAVRLLGNLITKLIEAVFLGLFNKILGGVFAMFKYALIVSVILVFFENINNVITYVDNDKLKESKLYNPIKKLAPTIYPAINERLKELKTSVNKTRNELIK